MDKTFILAPVLGLVTLLTALIILFYALGFDELYLQLTA